MYQRQADVENPVTLTVNLRDNDASKEVVQATKVLVQHARSSTDGVVLIHRDNVGPTLTDAEFKRYLREVNPSINDIQIRESWRAVARNIQGTTQGLPVRQLRLQLKTGMVKSWLDSAFNLSSTAADHAHKAFVKATTDDSTEAPRV